MRCRSGLLARAWPDTEHVGLGNTILLVGERRIQRANGECMRPCGFVQKWPNGRIERTQSLIIQVIQKIPEQTQVKLGSLGKTK